MSSITSQRSPSARAKLALAPVVSLGLLAGSVALAAPAQADHDRNSIRGCTVNAEKPTHEHGIRVNFKITIHCDDGKKRTVKVEQRRYEKDSGHDTWLGSDTFYRDFNRHDDTKHVNSRDDVPRYLDRYDGEEVYHKVRFTVKYENGKWSDWSRWSGWDESRVLYNINGRSR